MLTEDLKQQSNPLFSYTFRPCRLAHFSAETGLYASEVKTGDDMRQPLSQGLALFHGLVPVCLAFMSMGGQRESGKGRRCLLGKDLWQKGITGPYHRQFDSFHRQNEAICHDFEQEFDSFLQ